MKITKEVSKSIVDEMVNSNTNVINWNGYEIHVQSLVDLVTAIAIVSKVADTCFDGDGNYNPDMKEFITKVSILSLYTDIELPESAEEQYAFVYATDIYQSVIEYINEVQLSEIFDNIDKVIDYRIRVNSDSMMSGVSRVYARVEHMVDEFEEVFKGTDSGDIAMLIRSMSNLKIDEGKLVKEIISQQGEKEESK